MREFVDAEGLKWEVGVTEREGLDYKGRFGFEAKAVVAGAEKVVTLEDLRWNSEMTARRTLETMSEIELGRRLRWAKGRSR